MSCGVCALDSRSAEVGGKAAGEGEAVDRGYCCCGGNCPEVVVMKDEHDVDSDIAGEMKIVVQGRLFLFWLHQQCH